MGEGPGGQNCQLEARATTHKQKQTNSEQANAEETRADNQEVQGKNPMSLSLWNYPTLARWPTSIFDEMERDIPRVMSRTGEGELVRCDIRENDTHYTVSADIPGMSPDDVKVSVENGVLTLSAERKKEKKEEKEGKVIREERSYHKVHRSFALPEDVNADQIDGNMEHGVLTLKLPKAEPKQPAARTIQIKHK